jgi:hypothetical protein
MEVLRSRVHETVSAERGRGQSYPMSVKEIQQWLTPRREYTRGGGKRKGAQQPECVRSPHRNVRKREPHGFACKLVWRTEPELGTCIECFRLATLFRLVSTRDTRCIRRRCHHFCGPNRSQRPSICPAGPVGLLSPESWPCFST